MTVELGRAICPLQVFGGNLMWPQDSLISLPQNSPELVFETCEPPYETMKCTHESIT